MSFYLEMDCCLEKIYANADSKNFFIEICSTAQKIHEEVKKCNEEISFKKDRKKFISLLEELIESIDTENVTFVERIKFAEVSTNNVKTFLLCDQLLKKFSAELFHLVEIEFKMALFYELEEINTYIKTIEKIKLLKAKSMMIEKTFLCFYFRKKKR